MKTYICRPTKSRATGREKCPPIPRNWTGRRRQCFYRRMSLEFRRALEPPTEALTLISRDSVEATIAGARESPRRRMIQPFHRAASDSFHRMLNAVQPGSYVRPHRHLNPPKAEAFIVLRGAIAFFTFEEDGRIRDSIRLAADGDVIGVDLVPGLYHCLMALERDTVIYEAKTGPYAALTDKSYAPWAPDERDPGAAAYAKTLYDKFRDRSAAREGIARVSWRPPALFTERLLLRGYEPADAEAISHYATDPETTRYLAWDRHQSIDDAVTFLNVLVAHNYRTEQLDYAICLKGAPERVVGGIGVYLRSPQHERYEMGYVLTRAHWGKGLVPEAGRRLLEFLFANTSAERVETPILTPNARSRRAAEKMGQRFDGILRSALFLHGQRWDEALYSRVRSDLAKKP
jgi:cupin fold WbuC family metalloprotein